MKKHLFSENGQFYKANLHCHTNLSDGKCSPSEIKRRYKEKGYSVVAFTDHIVMIDHTTLNDEDFVALKGYELHVNSKREREWNVKKTYHLNFIAKSSDIEAQVCFNPKIAFGNEKDYIPFVRYKGDFYEYEYSPDCINEIIKTANENGFIVNYNHPNWSLQDYRDYGELSGLYGVELYNGFSTTTPVCDNNSQIYAQMLRKSPGLIPLATDDNHNAYGFDNPQSDSFRGFNMIKAEELSYDGIMNALLRGDTYASSGPLFEQLYVEDGMLHMKSTPVCNVNLVTQGRNGSRIIRENGETLTECEFVIDESNTPFRLEITDTEGKTAYTRMYFLDECK